jgi:hypothetical protein
MRNILNYCATTASPRVDHQNAGLLHLVPDLRKFLFLRTHYVWEQRTPDWRPWCVWILNIKQISEVPV